MAYYEKIPGDRIYLSPIDKDDAPKYTKWVNDAHVTDRLGISWMVFTEEREMKTLEDMSKDGYQFAIVRREGNELLGSCGLQYVDQVRRIAECGLFIGEAEQRGKGYGTEALSLLLRYSFNTLNLNNIILRVFAFNENAIACYEKLGFKLIGRRRQACFADGKYHDVLYMDILPEEFFKTNEQ